MNIEKKSSRNLKSYEEGHYFVSARVKLILFFALFVLTLPPLLVDEAFAGCCLDPEKGLNVYCTDVEEECSPDSYSEYSCDDIPDCTNGCCCYEYNAPYVSYEIPKGYCVYKNETEEGNIGELIFTPEDVAFVEFDTCEEFCSDQQIAGEISGENLLYFKIEVVEGYPKVEVSWALKQGVGDGLDKYVYFCEVGEDDNCINNHIDFIEADSPHIFTLDWDSCYKFYLNVTGLGSFEDNYSIACTGNEECYLKKQNELFCLDDTNTYGFCTYGNVLVDTGQECKENLEDYCNSKMGHLGMINQSNCNEDYLCFLDRHPSGLYSCYNCPVEGGMECYDYKSKEACETDSCNVGNCSWKSLGSEDGIDIGICVNTEESNCDNCGSVFSSSAEAPDFYQSGNEFLYSDCTEEILNLLSSDEEICELPELCYTGDDEETCLDYNDEYNCERNTCNVGDGAKCVWDDEEFVCGKDLDGNEIRDCSGLFGDRLEECEHDFYPPDSDLIEIGSVDDLENYKLKIRIWDRRNEDDSNSLISLGEGDEFKLCSPPNSDSNFIDCGASTSYYANAENLNSEEIYIKDLISEEKLSTGEVNTFNYFAVDKNFNIESKMNSITIDLSRLEGCTKDVSCGFEGVCNVVNRTCDAELSVFMNTCEAALDEFKENDDSYEPEEKSCDDLDNDCDGEIDEDLKLTYYYDGDKDGVGNKSNKTDLCVGKPLENYVVEAYDDSGKLVWDCNDSNDLISPLVEEDCDDGIDNNCNGAIDAKDADCIETGEQCSNCEDDDGDGLINEGCPDFDKDTYEEVNGAFKSICNCNFCSEVCLCGPDKFDFDMDGDGIQNDIDTEKETPLECHPEKNVWNALYITENGTAKDKDSDGVCDYADKCEDTVSGCPVELNLSSPNAGCPKSCADTGCWTDNYCSKCEGDCEACGGGNWQLCTKEVCESCSEDCVFTLVKEVNEIKYGNCTTCVGEECGELKEKEITECSDGIKNNDETDVDCGGPVCLPCDVGDSCKYNSDCKDDLKCVGGECIEPPEEDKCDDGDLNLGWETDVDCGGICPTKCDIGQKCDKDEDCISGICSDYKICVSEHHCENGEKDEGETDVDCGGKCDPCENGKNCDHGSDCESGYCKDGVCRPYEEKDSDGDGIPDVWEMEHGTDPLKADSDDDTDEEGLTNYEEYQFYINGTKILPNKADTDGDGATDKEEIDKGTDPTDPKDKPSNTGMLVLILVVLLIFLGILLYLFFTGSKKSQAKKPKTTKTEKNKEHPKVQISSMDSKQKTKEKNKFELKDKELFNEFESDMEKKVSQESSVGPKKIKPNPKFAYAPEEKETEKGEANKSHEKSEETKEESKESEAVEEDLNEVLQSSKKSAKVYEEIKKESSSDEIDNLIETLEEGVLKKEFDKSKEENGLSASKGKMKSRSQSSTSKKTSNKSKGTKKKKSSKK